jgi:hypothetical protein
MASDSDKHDWNPQRTENTLESEDTPASTGNGVPTHRMPRTEGPQSTFSHSASRTENYGSIVKDDADDERPALQHTQTSSTEIEDDNDLQIERTQTSKSAFERRQFAPIRTGDAEELTRLATSMDGSGSIARTSTRGSELQRRDTLAGINVGDAVLDPRSPEFDPYKWARM